MKSKEKVAEEVVIKDEIPGFRDFLATSALSGALAATGIPDPESVDMGEFTEFIASFCYSMADAMLVEKYKNNTRH